VYAELPWHLREQLVTLQSAPPVPTHG
jgi:hypothetical protein